jgi:hypothetical protein
MRLWIGHSLKWMAPLVTMMNDRSGDQVRLFPHWLLLIGGPLLNLLHPLQWSPFMAPLPSQLSRTRIYKMWLHPSPSFVQPASTTMLCLVPSGPPLSLLPTIPTTSWSSLLVDVSSMTPGRYMLPCPPASSRPQRIMTSPLIGIYGIFHSALIYLLTAVERFVALGLCNRNHTYKRHAIGIAPTREMQLELHLQDRCNWNCTYKTEDLKKKTLSRNRSPSHLRWWLLAFPSHMIILPHNGTQWSRLRAVPR